MLRYVDVPEEIGVALATEYAAATTASKRKGRSKVSLPKHIPVVATSNHRSTRTTLVPGGAGRYRLQVNATLRKAARAGRRRSDWHFAENRFRIARASRSARARSRSEIAPRPEKGIRSPHGRRAHAIFALVFRKIPRSSQKAASPCSRSPHGARRTSKTKTAGQSSDHREIPLECGSSLPLSPGEACLARLSSRAPRLHLRYLYLDTTMEAAGIHSVELIFLLLLLFVAGLAALAKRFQTPYPIILVIGGLILSLFPRIPRVELNPDIVFLLILPPLLFSSAFVTSWRDFRYNLVSISMLALRPGLVHGSRRRPYFAMDTSRFRLPPRPCSRSGRLHYGCDRRHFHCKASRNAEANHRRH